jgi:hypothetical protein
MLITSMTHYKNLNIKRYLKSIKGLTYYDQKCIKGYIPVYLLLLTLI